MALSFFKIKSYVENAVYFLLSSINKEKYRNFEKFYKMPADIVSGALYSKVIYLTFLMPPTTLKKAQNKTFDTSQRTMFIVHRISD